MTTASSLDSGLLDQQSINTVRFLAVDAVQKAKSGHPGLPMGAAPMAYVLWTRVLRHNPANPHWFNRDRFVLSAGHGSMLLYSLLHLTGYDLPLEQIKQFGQWGSITPGHPERGITPCVEVTTGPLGQGFGNGVGMAIAEAYLAARYNRPGFEIINHFTYGLVSDGDLMEGVTAEAASLAGHLKLGKLIYLYDDNRITLAASTQLTFTEDHAKRFAAYGWHTQLVKDGNDLEAIDRAIRAARQETERPSLILVRTHIGYGSPHKQDTFAAHGSPLGEEEVKFTKQNLGWPLEPPFFVPDRFGASALGPIVMREYGFSVENDGLLGRVIDPLGRPLDGNGPVASSQRLPVERPAVAIMDRAPVRVPLQTGLKVVDALIPIGRGQRELILGDRQIGKTAIAIHTILNQRGQDVVCVYCAIGQRASAVAKAVATLREKGAMDYTVVVVTEGNDPPGLAYIAPYAATSIAESFMEAGRDVLIVYDDLTHHARAYRELSLLLRRPPGREAFPGDIFYIHSRLLERATHLRQELGGGSLTALPIIETEAQDISAYIPTNLISITDGQIYLSPSLFELGVLPAIDVGKSVSRVGGKAQRAAYRAVAGDLKLAFAQFEELETFSQFGARLDDNTRKVIEHGRRIRACLKQPEFAPVSVPAQITVLLALTAELFDRVPLHQMMEAEHALREAAADLPAEVRERLDTADKLSDEDRETILQIARKALAGFQPKPEVHTQLKPKVKSGTDEKS